MFVGTKHLGNLRLLLSEAVQRAPIGTLVGWKALGDFDYGIVLGREGEDLLCLTMYDKTLIRDAGIKHYRDEKLTNELASTLVVPGVVMDIQRVPATKAFRKGLVYGPALKPYLAAAQLKLEALQTEQAAPVGSDAVPIEEIAIRELASNLGFKVKELDVVDGESVATLIGRNSTEVRLTIAGEDVTWDVRVRGESVGNGKASTTAFATLSDEIESVLTRDVSSAAGTAEAEREETVESTYGVAGKLAVVRTLLEGIEEAKWIQKAVKKPGRLPKVLGMTQEKYDSLSKDEKLAAIDSKLKEIEGDSGKKATSMRGALILGKRFVQGITKEATAAGDGIDEASDPRNLADTLATELITGSENIVSMVDYKRFMPELVDLIMRHLKKR